MKVAKITTHGTSITKYPHVSHLTFSKKEIYQNFSKNRCRFYKTYGNYAETVKSTCCITANHGKTGHRQSSTIQVTLIY